jgi:hypothetical protein
MFLQHFTAIQCRFACLYIKIKSLQKPAVPGFWGENDTLAFILLLLNRAGQIHWQQLSVGGGRYQQQLRFG